MLDVLSSHSLTLMAIFFASDRDVLGLVCMAVMMIPFGAFFGYLTGACTAGLFLLMDKLEPYLPGGTKLQPAEKKTAPHSAPIQAGAPQ